MTAKKPGLLASLRLQGLRAAPSQVFGAVRLVPLLRDAPRGDLRIARRAYGDTAALVDLGDRLEYAATYVPHALVVGWTEDGSPVAAFGATLAGRPGDARGRDAARSPFVGVRLLHRMVKREPNDRLRLLPQHLCLEGLLARHFNGPDVAWTEYSRRAISRGLDPRWEMTAAGSSIPGLADALRVFEIHEGQCGVLLFAGDLLASVFVVSHPDDYRDLHRTLLEDGYAEALRGAARWSGPSPTLGDAFDERRIHTVDDLRRELARARAETGSFHVDMAGGLVARPLQAERVYRAGPFSLQRFITDLVPAQENHVGEAIVRDDGTLEYAKSYRLSAAQTRRAYLLQKVAAHAWNLSATASALGISREDLIVRLDKAGFGYLIAEHVLRAAHKRAR